MKTICAVVFVLISFVSISQRAHLDKGDEFFKFRFYKEAIEEYKLALKEDVIVNKFYMTQQIARTYKLLFDYENAELWYSKLIALGDENSPENYLHYAQILCNNEKYKDAESVYAQYLVKAEKTDLSEQYKLLTSWPMENPDSLWDMSLYETNIETGSRSMGLHFQDNHMYYGMPVIQNFETKTAFYDLAKVERQDSINFGVPRKLPGSTNRSFYEGTPFVSPDGKFIYYTANGSERTKYRDKKKQKKDFDLSKSGINLLKIFRAENVNGNWENVMELNINSDNYNSAFPHITADGKRLFFASDREGTLGGFDLYTCTRINDSTWSEPMNLGDHVNSDQDEMYPFTNDTAFFYSSRGLPGYGGADVFWTYLDGIRSNEVHNMGIPVNSPKDDFSFILTPNEEGLFEGYLSSNRSGSHGYDHIVYFKQAPAPVYPDTIIGTALNKITLNPIVGVDIMLKKYEDDELQDDINDQTKEDGNITLILDKHIPYQVTFKKEGFKPVVIEIPSEDRDDVLAKFGKIQLEPVAVKNTVIKIPNIYFDFDKASIREESYKVLDNIVQYLNDNPDIRVELSAHTDSRGSDWYNLKLSERRAQSTVKFLVQKGISKSRLVPKGYGEKKILNQCKNYVKCTDEEHEFNRRVELKVL